MANNGFWNDMQTAGPKVWNFIDELWKYLRWVTAAAAGSRIYEKSQNTSALVVSILLLVIATIALAAKIHTFTIEGLTEKGKDKNDGWAIIQAFAIFIFAIAMGIAVGSIITKLLILAGA